MTVGNDVVLSFSEPITADREPFSEYLWMEHEEEFNRQVEEQLREEEFIERCIQELLEEEEEWEWFIPSRDLPSIQTHTDAELVINSSLNPFAKEFVPGIQKHTM